MLFIKVNDNAIIGHPVTLDNLRMIYPDFDVDAPQYGYVPFVRATVPAVLSPYIVHDPVYVMSCGIVNEVYNAREITADEKQQLFATMEERKPFPSWVLNQARCVWEPPIAYPTDGKKYQWGEDTQSWVEIV